MFFGPDIEEYELEDKPLLASQAYEALIDDGIASASLYVNLMALYLTCLDPGYAMNKGCTPTFCAHCFDGIDRVHELAASNLLDTPNVRFWYRYSKFVILGERPDDFLWPNYVGHGITYDVLIYLPASFSRQCSSQLSALKAECAPRDTYRRRWIMSVVASNYFESFAIDISSPRE